MKNNPIDKYGSDGATDFPVHDTDKNRIGMVNAKSVKEAVFGEDNFELPNICFDDPQPDTRLLGCPQSSLPTNIEPSPNAQPKVEPSPCLRKSTISKRFEAHMYPLGKAETFNHKKKKGYIGTKLWSPVHGGNPFAEMMKSRNRVEIFDNRNDLSDLKDLPSAAVKENDGFVQIDRYVEKLVLLVTKENPSEPLNAPGQPPYLEVPLTKLRKSGSIFAKLLDEKDKGKKSRLRRNSVVYSFDSAPQPNLHIQEYAIYLDGMLGSDFARASPGYRHIESMTNRQIWAGLKTWGIWATNGSFREIFTEEETRNALLVSLLIRDMDYFRDLRRMVRSRYYHVMYSSVRAIWALEL